MPRGHRLFTQNLALRALGLFLLILGALGMRYLFHGVHVPPRHEASAIEMGMAAISFMSLSVGGALTSLGAHIFDQVSISERRARGSTPFPETAMLSQDEFPRSGRSAFFNDLSTANGYRTGSAWGAR